MIRPFLSTLAVCLSLSSGAFAQTTWFVDDDSTCTSGCGSFGTPFQEIQDAIASPSVLPGDTIRVQPGTYAPIDYLGKDLLIQSTSGAAVTEIVGVPGCSIGACSVVTFQSGETLSAVLDGFSITGGEGTLLIPTDLAGGGIFFLDSSATIRNCRIYGNSLFGNWLCRGGGIGCLGTSSPEVYDCVIENNSVAGQDGGPHGGGGVSGGASLFGCTLRNNLALGEVFIDGGGGGAQGAYLEDCVLEGNVAEGWGPPSCSAPSIVAGGGAFDCTLVDCLLNGNRVVVDTQFEAVVFGGYGGGAALSSADDCVFVDNSIVKEMNVAVGGCGGSSSPLEMAGAGLYNANPWGSSSPSPLLVDDCTILRNTIGAHLPGEVSRSGGALAADVRVSILAENEADMWPAGQFDLLERCTVVNHDGPVGSAAVAATTIDSSILWQNTPISALAGSTVRYSAVEGGYPGTGNIASDPLFWNVDALDVFLKPGSPCIDTGNPGLSLDPDGSAPDMGALPFDPAHCGVPTRYCTAKINSQGCSPGIATSGTPSLTGPDDFFVTASDVINQKPGIMIWGLGPLAAPFQFGTLCVASPLRTGPQNSGGNVGPDDCSGTFSFHVSQAFLAAESLGWGDTVFAQYWYRDPNDPSGFGSGLSDAMRFTVCQ